MLLSLVLLLLLLLLPPVGHAPGSEEVDPSSEFGIVVLYRLGAHTILMGAEVDGFDPQAPPDCGPINGKPYVEMKTYR